ncbi:O-antigen ligase family protein [Flagellimonas flava]|uniref:O-antigen ligase n=1 Tax=Flagellimonas flava TaxID=570519 RepID=A0A1M5L3M9_9FLAO|nr:O-antigen ligase family protein [Allomuricauda flava]SHG59023.1 O-antigen ligase [Allomuricauda flava]
MPSLDKKTISKINLYLVGAALASVLFSYFVSSLCIIAALVLAVIFVDKSRFTKKRLGLTVAIALPFFIFLISGLFSAYQENAASMISKRLPLLLVPLIVLNLEEIKKKDLVNLLILFGVSCNLVGVIGIFKGVDFFLRTGQFFGSNYVFYIFKVQHVYLATFIVFVLIGSFFVFKGASFRKKGVLVVVNTINLLVFPLLSSKISLIILLVLGLFYIKDLRKSLGRNFFLLVLGAIVLSIMVFAGPYAGRINQLMTWNEPRLDIWPCAWKLISSNSFIGFVPLGDFQESLNVCYYQGTGKLDLEGFSTHNQYLEFWIVSGFLGMLAYLVSLLYLLKHAYAENRLLLRAFLALFFLFGLTECVLSRQYGITFYAVMVSFLVFSEDLGGNFSTKGRTKKN